MEGVNWRNYGLVWECGPCANGTSDCSRWSWEVYHCTYDRPFLCQVSQPVPPDKEMDLERARLGPAARLGPQPPGVRLEPRIVHGGIIGEIQAKGRKFP